MDGPLAVVSIVPLVVYTTQMFM